MRRLLRFTRNFREMKFKSGVPTITKVAKQLAVRRSSGEFRVVPLDDNPEMVVIHRENAEFALPADRCALVSKGQAYAFSVAGQITDAALVRSDVVGGMIHSKCHGTQ
jgi:hypothetical protein